MDLENPYLIVLERNLPRVLSLVSRDSLGSSLGIADRRYWAWKTVDFPNASIQSLAGGFARLSLRQNLDTAFSGEDFTSLSLDLILAIGKMTSRSGGLAEAFPGEDSFCVTGQVLSEGLDALTVLEDTLSTEQQQKCLDVLSPLASFLLRNDETHGVISNHLATSALALARWAGRTGDNRSLARAEAFLGQIEKHASDEGWFLEYSGADPGYQTWAVASLAQICDEVPHLVDSKLLSRGLSFLAAFALSNGSFANGAGARLTSFMMTVGPELMAGSNLEAAFLASFARSNILDRRFVSLDAVDEPNIAPFFNDIVRSAQLFDRTPIIESTFRQPEEIDFPSAGLYLRHKDSRSIIVSATRGGWVCLSEEGRRDDVRPEPSFKDLSGRIFVARAATSVDVTNEKVSMVNPIRRFRTHSQSPQKQFVLRVFMLSVGRSRTLRELLKQLLAFFLVTRVEKPIGYLRREVNMYTGEINDQVQAKLALSESHMVGAPHHMASYGYWRQ